jgi:uncharacterized membrane protein
VDTALARDDKRKWKRKEVKRPARFALRRNFAICFLASIILGFTGANPFALSDNINASTELLHDVATEVPNTPFADASNAILQGVDTIKATTSLGLESSAGVISTVYTRVRNADNVGNALLSFVNSSMFDNRLSNSIIAAAGLSLTLLLFLFVSEILRIGSCRLFLENRLYPKTPLSRLFFIYQMRRLLASTHIVFLKYLRLALWGLTVVGFPIKYYSYYLVPFIQAENPEVPSRAIFKLSENMVRGHRFRMFLFDLSFIGWNVLSVLTFGIVGYVWLNPYRAAARAELYATLRALAKEKELPGVEYLKDDALFTIPAVVAPTVAPDVTGGGTGGGAVLETYPLIIQHPLAKRMHGLPIVGAKEHYPVLNLILMFFLFSFIGWIWECAIAFVQSGIFVNRGSLYGPWVPIYGFGGLAILVFLNRFNKEPLFCFFAAILLCGIIEYVSATVIWDVHHVKYWDYSGFFFNIQGRVCLESLLSFGVLGMVGLYLIAPATDVLLQTIPYDWRQRLCVLLIMAFGTDIIASQIAPHTGQGITTTLENTKP